MTAANTAAMIVFVYLAAGVLMLWTFRSNRNALLDVAMKVSRVVPGFRENFERGATRFGFGPNAMMMSVLFNVFAWPFMAMSVAFMFMTARKIDKFEAALHSERGVALGGSIFDAREDLITERCEQVRKVFGDITHEERIVFSDFYEKIAHPNVWRANDVDVESIEMTLGGANPNNGLEPGMGVIIAKLRPIDGGASDGGVVGSVSVAVSHHRDVRVASNIFGYVDMFVETQMVFARVGDNVGFGVLDVEWRIHETRDDADGIAFVWEPIIVAEQLEGITSDEDDDAAAEEGSEAFLAYAIFDAMRRSLNEPVFTSTSHVGPSA